MALEVPSGSARPSTDPRRDPHLIRRTARDNPTWGRRRIQAELALLGYDVAALTVAKYMGRTSPRPSPTWRVFLETHLPEIVAVDFFLVPTLTFRMLFAFVVLRHDRRELLHVNVTDHPTAAWTAQQIVETFPENSPPKYLLRDRDAIYGNVFQRRVAHMRVQQILIAPHAPWQNPFAERLIGSIRRECLDHFVVLNERHLRRLLRAYLAYYNTARPHQALGNNSPIREQSSPRRAGASWCSHRSAAFITATSAPPDHPSQARLPKAAARRSRLWPIASRVTALRTPRAGLLPRAIVVVHTEGGSATTFMLGRPSIDYGSADHVLDRDSG